MYFGKLFKVFGVIVLSVAFCSWISRQNSTMQSFDPNDSLRQLYSRPISQWPKPNIDAGISYIEFAALPADSSWLLVDKDPKVKLGQLLFFDPRLSQSNQISCSSCHDPEIGWGDARRVSLGNDHLLGSRNTPSLLNISIHKSFFWDGRSGSLEDQALNPIGTHHEMNMDPMKLPLKIASINGYKTHFKAAFGSEEVTMPKILESIATFEKIIKSRQSKFDRFLHGNYKAMSDQEIAGLDLFRGKARCMNCHYGPYFTDEKFHNIGLSYYGRKYEDLGRYVVTKDPKDVGKFRTPILRDVMKTSPWMHNGLFDNIIGLINVYNSGMHQLDNKNKNPLDPLYPKTDSILQPLNLTESEKENLASFLNAITATQYKMHRPELPF